jgi:mono/diheme cytochrome c family protein
VRRSVIAPDHGGRTGLLLALLVVLALAITAGGCGGSESTSPLAEQGRQVYLAQCTACHAADPAKAGPVGPPVKGASKPLLEAKVVRGEYPAGYTPKRSTNVMPAQPALGPSIPALAEYLN